MPVPKRRTSRAKRDRRRAHDALSAPALGKCPKCGTRSAPHRACPTCGEYRGRRILTIAEED